MTSKDVTARVAGEADEPFIKSVFKSVRAPEFAQANLSEDQLEKFLEQQYFAMRTYYDQVFPETVYSVLSIGDQQIGFEALRDTVELHLIDIALLPEFRNRGVGTGRLLRLQDKAMEADKEIILSVELFNPAKSLYERLGFETYDERGLYARMKWVSAKTPVK